MSRRSLERLAGRLHQRLGQRQLPLGTKDSRNLLSLLNKEVQLELDRKHPGPSHTDQHPLPRAARLPERNPFDSASAHLGSVLANPLLQGPRRSTAGSRQQEESAWWNMRVITGAANVTNAKAFLASSMRGVATQSPSRKKLLLQQSGVGTQVLTWLEATHGDQLVATLQDVDQGFLKLLILALIAEDHGFVVLDWTRGLRFRPNSQDTPHAFLGIVMRNYVYAHEVYGFELDSVLRAVLECYHAYPADFIASKQTTLHQSCSRLFHQVFRRDHRVSGNTWAMLQQTSVLGKSAFVAAMLDLYHPIKPTALSMLDLLLHKDFCIVLENSGKTMSRSPILVDTCIDAAQLLIEEHEFQDAAWLLQAIESQIRTSDHKHSERAKKTRNAMAVPDSRLAFG